MTESILQFGGGKFLRAFVDLFVDEINRDGGFDHRVVVVQSSDSDRARVFNDQDGYHVLIRGLQGGQPVDSTHRVRSVSRALVAGSDWSEVLDVARSKHLHWLVSNTTEAGLTLEDSEVNLHPGSTPRSFPAKLAEVLHARYESGGTPVQILPCELVDRNADRLRDLTIEQGRLWGFSPRALDWIRDEITWSNTLVDRIVSEAPKGHALAAEDALLCAAEPFATWAIEAGAPWPHAAIQTVERIDAYSLRKVRILNGAHTALVQKALGKVETVLEVMEDPDLRSWLESLMLEEIVPTVEDRVQDAEGFARTALERFANPYLHHRLADIALHQDEKIKVRLLPTYEEYIDRFGRKPPRLSEALNTGG